VAEIVRQCLLCGQPYFSKSNLGLFGYCSGCTPKALKQLKEMPQKGKISDIPEKYKHFFYPWFLWLK